MTVDTQAVLNAWRLTTAAVARSPGDFTGRDKEKKVFRRLRQELECLAPELAISEPDSQVHFNRWSIDLVCSRRDSCVAIEGKYKILSDRAVPDNRKAAFFDLYKLCEYVASGRYSAGLFLWLTDVAEYRQQARGDSVDFSTHQGRVYRAGTPLRATRAGRTAMPLPLVLPASLAFDWEPVDAVAGWYRLAICLTTLRHCAVETRVRGA